jgi:hypothetical protein
MYLQKRSKTSIESTRRGRDSGRESILKMISNHTGNSDKYLLLFMW